MKKELIKLDNEISSIKTMCTLVNKYFPGSVSMNMIEDVTYGNIQIHVTVSSGIYKYRFIKQFTYSGLLQ